MTVYGKNSFQLGLFVDVLLLPNPFAERGFCFLSIAREGGDG
jgi:hypothetical protein